ncbi:uncharacterized protein LOC124689259 [Lolium rigidum]|uniref:uncharacterized protein LOC124689259 n=1 Tax=Lolium rigidum TaxID=89674 RepID=UPI001F5D9125|nr:uncharacterized protein LOC124689259 [Lolium rigidum]
MAPPAPHLADEILEEIFIRLPTAAAIARASTACASFRRIITARPFLRRFHKLHPPPLLGFIADKGGFHPAGEPHPSAPLARAFADAADFSYSFVPKPNDGPLSPWCPRDARDGRVLLECGDCGHQFGISSVFTRLAVCDPLSRRYVLLPPIPKKMTVQQDRLLEFEPMLAPIGDDGDEDETSFKVICTAYYKIKLVAFVFSSVTGQWHIAASPSWRSLGTVEPSWKRMYRFNYLRGCFYWTSLWCDKLKLLVLDTGTMKFSAVDVLADHPQLTNQPRQSVCMSTVVEGSEGALEMFTLVGVEEPTSFHLYHTTQQNIGGSSSEWLQKNVIALPRGCLYSTVGATEGFLFLRCVGRAQWDDTLHRFVLGFDKDVEFFSLDVKTFELKQVCRATYYNFPTRVHSYFGFPLPLSKPSL